MCSCQFMCDHLSPGDSIRAIDQPFGQVKLTMKRSQ